MFNVVQRCAVGEGTARRVPASQLELKMLIYWWQEGFTASLLATCWWKQVLLFILVLCLNVYTCIGCVIGGLGYYPSEKQSLIRV